MAKKNVRSKFVKELFEDKAKLDKEMEQLAKETAGTILSETFRETVRKMINEDDGEDYEEEEVDVNPTNAETQTMTDTAEPDVKSDEVDNPTSADETEETPEETSSANGSEDEEEFWKGMESYKVGEDEYDLTSMDKESLIKVMKVMKPEDGVSVVRSEYGNKFTLTDDNEDTEYVIELSGDQGEATDMDESVEHCCDSRCCESDDEEDAYVVELEGPEDDEYEVDFDGEEDDFDDEEGTVIVELDGDNDNSLGYTDNYISKSAMDIELDPNEPDDVIMADLGVPVGSEKPYANKGDGQPFVYEVDEADELDETTSVTQNNNNFRGTPKSNSNSNKRTKHGRNSSRAGKRARGTGESPYSGVEESIIRKANAIFRENKELKESLPKLLQRLEEAKTVNRSLMNIMKIVSENATTKSEKNAIMSRFNEVKTCEESDKLAKIITEELKQNGKTLDIDKVMNGHLMEEASKNARANHKPMYSNASFEFMKRMDNLRKV